jgi:hypothetical protein
MEIRQQLMDMDVHELSLDEPQSRGAPCNSRIRAAPSTSLHRCSGSGEASALSPSIAVVCQRIESVQSFKNDDSPTNAAFSSEANAAVDVDTHASVTWLCSAQPRYTEFLPESTSQLEIPDLCSSSVPAVDDEFDDAVHHTAFARAIGEGAERVHPLPQLQLPNATADPAVEGELDDGHIERWSFVSDLADAHTWPTLVYKWMFPPMRSYPELCENIEHYSLGFLGTDNAVRRVCVYTVKSKAFERLSLLMILLNCVFLALDSNDPDHSSTVMGAVLRYAEWVFMLAFTVEMVLKILGLGLYGAKGAYLRDAWNVVDCVVVVVGWLSLLPSIENISAMRTVRVLRPLRTITGVEGMRMLVATLLRSLPMLLDVLILCAFLFLIFGTIGVQTFAGVLRQHCGTPADGIVQGSTIFNVTEVATNDGITCGDDIIQLSGQSNWFDMNGADSFISSLASLTENGCSEIVHHASVCLPITLGSSDCQHMCSDKTMLQTRISTWTGVGTSEPFGKQGSGYNCDDSVSVGADSTFGVHCFIGNISSNPNYGLTSFDNILWSWLTIFQCVSLEGWTEVMYAVQVSGAWPSESRPPASTHPALPHAQLHCFCSMFAPV